MYTTTSKPIRLAFAALALTLGSGLALGKLHAAGDFQRQIALNDGIVTLPGVAIVAHRPGNIAAIDQAVRVN